MCNNKNIILEDLYFSKIILMLLIVLYHSMVFFTGNWFNQKPVYDSKFFDLFSQILNSFHIYAFVLISGYIYAYLRFERNKYLSFSLFIKTKYKRLMVPYIFISLFWVIPFYFYFFKAGIAEIGIKYFLGTSPSQLWFLLMLFNIFIVIFFIGDFIYSSYYRAIILSIIIYGIGIVGGKFFPNIYQILSSSKLFIYFTIGMLIYKSNLYILKKIHSYTYLLIFIILWLLKSYIYDSLIYKIYILVINLFINIEGSIMAFIILGRIAERLKNSKYNYENSKLYNFKKTKFHYLFIASTNNLLCH